MLNIVNQMIIYADNVPGLSVDVKLAMIAECCRQKKWNIR